jgi:hypothetical protein
MSRDNRSYDGEYTEDHTDYDISSLEDMEEVYTDNESPSMDMVEHHYDYDSTSLVYMEGYIDAYSSMDDFLDHTMDTMQEVDDL